MTEATAPTVEKADQAPTNGQPEQPKAPVDPGPFVFSSIHEMIEQSPPREGESVFKVNPRAWIASTANLELVKYVRAKNLKEACERAMDVSKVPNKDVFDVGMAIHRKRTSQSAKGEVV